MDFIATITLDLPMTARNEDAAQDRHQTISDFIERAIQEAKGKPRFLDISGGIDVQVEIEEN